MRRLLAASIFLLASCIHTSVQRVDPAVRAPRSPDAVEVLGSAPQQPHSVIAVIESTGETVFDGFGDLQDKLIAEAAKLGGDALIVGPKSTKSEFILTGTAMVRSDRRRLTGEVIVFEPAK